MVSPLVPVTIAHNVQQLATTSSIVPMVSPLVPVTIALNVHQLTMATATTAVLITAIKL
jgi:hypothetical protein